MANVRESVNLAPDPSSPPSGGFGSIPKHETEDVLLPLLASLTVSFHPLRNAAIKLSASFTTEFKMFFSGHGIHSYPEVVEVLRWHTQPDFKVKKLAFLQTLHERTEKRLWTFFLLSVCPHSRLAASSWPLPSLVWFRDSAEKPEKLQKLAAAAQIQPNFQQRHWKSNSLFLVFVEWAELFHKNHRHQHSLILIDARLARGSKLLRINYSLWHKAKP